MTFIYGGGDAGLLPDTAMSGQATGSPIAPALLVAAGVTALAVVRRRGSQLR